MRANPERMWIDDFMGLCVNPLNRFFVGQWERDFTGTLDAH